MITEQVLILGILLVFCWGVAYYDWKTLTIPNIIPLAIIGFFLILSPFILSGFNSFLWQILGFIVAFVTSFLLYLFGPMGGGDVKFFTAIALFVKIETIWIWVLCITLSGLLITLLYIAIRVSGLMRADGISVRQSYAVVRNTEIPYGPAITLGTTFFTLSF